MTTHISALNLSTLTLNDYTVEDLKTIRAAACQHAQEQAQGSIDYNGELGYCGFAWVNIYGIKGNTRLGKRMKAAGFEKDYTGAYSIWNPSGLGTQCMLAKEKGAEACAAVFRAAGFKVSAGSRAD